MRTIAYICFAMGFLYLTRAKRPNMRCREAAMALTSHSSLLQPEPLSLAFAQFNTPPAMTRRTALSLLAAAPACAQTTVSPKDTVTKAGLVDDNKTLVVTIGEKLARFTAEKGKFWDHLVTSADGQRVIVALQRGSPEKGAWFEDIHEFSLADYLAAPDKYQMRAVPLKTELDDAGVQMVFSASKDGSRLLVSIHYCFKQEGTSRRYRWHPYFFDTRTGEITIVTP